MLRKINMNKEKQRIAIAEACGLGDYDTNMNGWHDESIQALPDYLNDLNAMHEAENTLTDGQYELFTLHLGPLTSQRKRKYISSASAQRAEAFLRTIGKWEDE